MEKKFHSSLEKLEWIMATGIFPSRKGDGEN